MLNKQRLTSISASALAVCMASMLTLAVAAPAFATAVLDLTGPCDQPTSTNNNSGGGGPCGFVGKGDVQNAFDPTWTNKQLQDRANDVNFAYVSTVTYDVVDQFTTDQPSSTNTGDCVPNTTGHGLPYICTVTHTTQQTKTTNIDAAVNADPRKANQFTGFKLMSEEISVSGDSIPNVGDSCPQGPNNDCQVISVTQTGDTSSFYAVWNNGGTLVNSNPIPVTIV